ncbi:O-antigen ligase family protein [Halomonas denitrificans]|uniref:O-antigen ligase family protein n=1 Tax=Halomonas denitrificans TaxID=370769 RepID=UPI000D3D42CE|nr:O-antigen ligase family protein [Halomonas denitrificans]
MSNASLSEVRDGDGEFFNYVSLFFLCATIVVPVFLTSVYTSRDINVIVMGLQLVFVLANYRSLSKCMSHFLSRWVMPTLLVGVFFICALSWFFLGVEVVREDRFYFYIVQFFFYFSFVAYLQEQRVGLKEVFFIKGFSLLIVLVVFLIVWLSSDPAAWEGSVKPHPPLYRHIRHFNYDLFIFTGLLCWAYLKNFVSYMFFAFLMVLIGFLTAWTGARGQAAATFVLIVLLMLTFRKEAVALAGSMAVWLLFGASLLLLSGETHMLFDSVSTSARDSMNGISSGRLAIWGATWEVSQISPIFGLGPEAFYNYNVIDANIVQPHSLIFQVLIEFGFLGLSVVSVLALFLICKSFLAIYVKRSSEYLVFMYLFMLSILAFSLVDGLFYHGVPFSLSLMVLAYINVSEGYGKNVHVGCIQNFGPEKSIGRP